MSSSPKEQNHKEGRKAATKGQDLHLIKSHTPPETNLHAGGSCASTPGSRGDRKRSTSPKGISETPEPRTVQNDPALEIEQVPTTAQASSPGLDHASKAADVSDLTPRSQPCTVDLEANPSSKQRAQRDTINPLPSSDLGRASGSVKCPSGSRISSETGPTASDLNILEDPQPPANPGVAGPSRRGAPRACQAWNLWHRPRVTCLGMISCLVAVAVAPAYIVGCDAPSVGVQQSCNLVFLAGFGVMSGRNWMLHATQQLYQRLPALQPAPRYSSGGPLGAGLGQTYTDLSQALAASDSLHPVPALISKKRAEALKFKLPKESLTAQPLHRFLQQNLHIDEDLLRLILSLGQIATLTLRQQQLTIDTLRSIQRNLYFGTFEQLRIRVVGLSTQESSLKIRLDEHFGFLDKKIAIADKAARKVLQDYITLASTTEAICQSSVQDQQRLLFIKGQTASQFDWLVRASIQLVGLSEPEDLAKISQNVKLAEGIHAWAQDVVDLLQRVASHLLHAKANIGLLMEIMGTQGTVTWDVVDKDRELIEFLAQLSDGVRVLKYNTAAWDQLQVAGHI